MTEPEFWERGPVALRPLRPEDGELLYRWINDRELVELSAPFREVSREEHERWFRTIRQDGSVCIRAITDWSTGALIGYCQLKEIDLRSGNAELQIRIGDRGYFDRGAGTAAVMLLLEHAFGALGLHRVHLHVFESNHRARACYRKCGFREEGTLREAVRISDGYEDLVAMAILRDACARHGEERPEAGAAAAADWNAFTEGAYLSMLRTAKGRYEFCGYEEALTRDAPHVIWRHDIDMSVHRAARLAALEEQAGVQATYFFMLSSAFYNLHEPAVLVRARAIPARGHHVGLHFDAGEQRPPAGGRGLAEAMRRQRGILEDLLQAEVRAVSFHNPELAGVLDRDDMEIGGLINVYGSAFRERYKYCSDSNGYWRFDALPDLLAAGTQRYLHALTHPEWWTPTPMAPRERVQRCVQGRAAAVMAEYDACLARGGRLNIGRDPA